MNSHNYSPCMFVGGILFMPGCGCVGCLPYYVTAVALKKKLDLENKCLKLEKFFWKMRDREMLQ